MCDQTEFLDTERLLFSYTTTGISQKILINLQQHKKSQEVSRRNLKMFRVLKDKFAVF